MFNFCDANKKHRIVDDHVGRQHRVVPIVE